MVTHASAVTRNHAEVFSDGNILAIALHQLGGANLVLYDPLLENGMVVVTAGVVSGGAEHEHVDCFDVGRLSAGADWHAHVAWREPGGAVVPVATVRGAAAREAIARCAGSAR